MATFGAKEQRDEQPKRNGNGVVIKVTPILLAMVFSGLSFAGGWIVKATQISDAYEQKINANSMAVMQLQEVQKNTLSADQVMTKHDFEMYAQKMSGTRDDIMLQLKEIRTALYKKNIPVQRVIDQNKGIGFGVDAFGYVLASNGQRK